MPDNYFPTTDQSGISIDPYVPISPKLSLDHTSEITKTLTPDAIKYGSENGAFGVADKTGLTQSQISTAMSNGQEALARDYASNKINSARIQWAKDAIDKYGDTLPDGVLQTMVRNQEPSSVFEEHYATSYMNYLNWPKDKQTRDSWAYTSQNNLPELWDWVKREGSTYSAQSAYSITKLQQAQQETTWKDHVNTIVPDIFTAGVYGEVQMRTGAGGTSAFTGIGLGSNLQAQSDAMDRISDFDEWRKEYDRIYDSLPPAYRSQWVQDMLYKSNPSIVADNLSTALTAYLPGKLTFNLGRNIINPAAREAAFTRAFAGTRANVEIANMQGKVQQMINAVTDMTQPRPTNIPPEVAAPAMAGDIEESAVNRVAIDGINRLYPNNNPLSELINRLQAINAADNSLATSNPGNLGREAANRLHDMLDSMGKDYVDTVFNELLQRVDRTPTAELKAQLHAIQHGLDDLYSSPDNQVLNVSRSIWLPGYNNRMHNVAVGTPDGKLFKSLEEAKASARRSGSAIKGDYAVGPEDRLVLVRKENLIKALRASADGAATEEGRLRATKRADELQKELDEVPRHQTGVTIETQRIGPDYVIYPERFGPPGEPKPISIPTTEVSPEATGLKQSAYDVLKAKLGREPTFEEEIAALETPVSHPGEGWVPPGQRSTKRGKTLPDIGEDEHILQYNIRKKMEREWEAMSPAEREAYLNEAPPTEDKLLRRLRATPNALDKPIVPENNPPLLNILAKPGKGSSLLDNILKKKDAPPIIKQQGNGYYILHTVFLPENAKFVRDGIITNDLGGLTKEEFRAKLAKGEVSTGIPNDWAHNYVSALLNKFGLAAPSEVLSYSENLNRQIATHGPAVLLGLMKRGLKPLSPSELPPKYWKDFNRLIRFGQNAWNEETRTPGIWFNTMSDVDGWYRQNIGRGVTEPEVRAYFAFKQIMLDDLNFRNLSVMSRKLAMGARQHAIRYTGENGEQVSTPFFEGVRLDRIPETGRALVVNHDGTTTFNRINYVMRKQGLAQDILDGRAQIIHLMDPGSRPLRDLDARPTDYVISYDTEEKPLGMEHVNRLGGGHLSPKWDWYLKQADVDTTPTADGDIHVYNGDKTLLSFRTRAEALLAAEYLDPVRDILSRAVKLPQEEIPYDIMRWEGEGGLTRDIPLSERDRLINEAALASQKTGIPFTKLLDLWVAPNAPFDVHQPLTAVAKGTKIIDMGEEGAALRARHGGADLIDATRKGSLLGQVMTEFTQERDAEGLFTMRWKGTESNPQFAYGPADMVDPITSMERGYKNITQSMFMHDMKQYSVEHWLQQAWKYLDVDSVDEVRNNPLKHFYHPQYKPDIAPVDYWMLEGNRRNALDFLGLQDKYSLGLTQLGQQIADSFFGQNKVLIKPLTELPSINKIGDALKNFAFYSYITGVKSFFTQAATLSYIYMTAGTENATKATAAMTMYGLYRINPNLLEGIDRELVKYMGWQPGRFSEAVRMLEGSGFGHIGPEHAFKQGETSLGLQSMDNPGWWALGPKMAMRGGKAVLDASAIPFELGAATTRISGFFTAYLEHLAQAPGGVIDRQLQSAILTRASLLDINMSRAHNTRFQNRFSIPLQMMSYDIRMAQMMWGKNLTVEEKQRLFAFSSMLYGLRGGGLALFGFPIAGATMQTLQDNGYVPGDNSLADIAVNGFPSWFFAMLSGFTNPEGKKTWIDPSNWGNRGVDLIDKFFDQNKTVADTLVGAAGSAISNTWDHTWGIRRMIGDLGKGDNGYKATSDDWLQLFDILAATKDIHQTYLALQTGKVLTDKGTNITDSSKVETFLRNFIGLKTIDIADSFARQKVIGDYSRDIRAMQQHVVQEIMRMNIDANNNDVENAMQHWRNANNIMKAYIPEHMHQQVMQAAQRNIPESMAQRTDEKLNIQYRQDFETYRKLYTGH